jgi:hypothetical protein
LPWPRHFLNRLPNFNHVYQHSPLQLVYFFVFKYGNAPITFCQSQCFTSVCNPNPCHVTHLESIRLGNNKNTPSSHSNHIAHSNLTYLAGQPVLAGRGLLPQQMSPSSTPPRDLTTACHTEPLRRSLHSRIRNAPRPCTVKP